MSTFKHWTQQQVDQHNANTKQGSVLPKRCGTCNDARTIRVIGSGGDFEDWPCPNCADQPSERQTKTDSTQAQDEIRDLHKPILKWLKENDVAYQYTDPTKKTRAVVGAWDFVMSVHGHTFWVECKTQNGDLSPAQEVFRKRLLSQGMVGGRDFYIVRSMEDFWRIVQ